MLMFLGIAGGTIAIQKFYTEDCGSIKTALWLSMACNIMNAVVKFLCMLNIEQKACSSSEKRIGFDRLLQNGAFSEIQVHAIRLKFHSIIMRVGNEKTNETSESLLENEEKWLNK